jgi:hypothetical protein
MCGLVLERDAREILAELLAHAQVHLVVHQPQRHLGDLGREFLDLDAVELVHVQADQLVHVQHLLAAAPCGWRAARPAPAGAARGS